MIRPKVIVVRAILKLISILFHAFRWNNLREMVDQKRDEITVAHGFQNFNIECNETIVSLSLYHSLLGNFSDCPLWLENTKI